MDARPGWYAVFAGPRIALMKVLQAHETAAALRARILRHLAAEAAPELADIRIVRARSGFDASIPSHTTAVLEYLWRCEQS
jgi:hypothetical protein